MLASFDLLAIEINSHTDSFSKKGMPQHSEASCTLGCVSSLSITPSLALRKIVLNGKGGGGTEAQTLQSYLFISLKEELWLKGKKLLNICKSRKRVDTSSKAGNLKVFMGLWDSSSGTDHSLSERRC